MVRNILIGVGALVVVAGVGYGVYSFMNTGDETVEFGGQTLQSADICNAVLAYSAEIGVVPAGSSLSKETTTSGDADNRRVCSLEGGGEDYEASVDLRCTDMHNPQCTDLYKVTGPKDAVLYQRVPA
jgi:hypothetical protein